MGAEGRKPGWAAQGGRGRRMDACPVGQSELHCVVRGVARDGVYEVMRRGVVPDKDAVGT